jgi:pSer/pThr/pTyr-binding forkhead associated (FHA) protein
VTLRDLNSLNGTYVNGARVEETVLRSADEIQIGKFKLVYWQAAS